MPVVHLARHGQATLTGGAYDALSEAGRRQADVLGAALSARCPRPADGVPDPGQRPAAAFGGYLRHLGLVPATTTLTLLQGDDLGRPGILRVELRDGEPGVRVSGTAWP